jgi:hypothetical protein
LKVLLQADDTDVEVTAGHGGEVDCRPLRATDRALLHGPIIPVRVRIVPIIIIIVVVTPVIIIVPIIIIVVVVVDFVVGIPGSCLFKPVQTCHQAVDDLIGSVDVKVQVLDYFGV